MDRENRNFLCMSVRNVCMCVCVSSNFESFDIDMMMIGTNVTADSCNCVHAEFVVRADGVVARQVFYSFPPETIDQ